MVSPQACFLNLTFKVFWPHACVIFVRVLEAWRQELLSPKVGFFHCFISCLFSLDSGLLVSNLPFESVYTL